MPKREVVYGTSLGYAEDVPQDGNYIVTGYVDQGGERLPVNEPLPASSDMRKSTRALAVNLRLGRLKLMPPAKTAAKTKAPAKRAKRAA